MIRKLKNLIDNYRLSKESKKLIADKTLTSIGTNLSHLNVMDI